MNEDLKLDVVVDVVRPHKVVAHLPDCTADLQSISAVTYRTTVTFIYSPHCSHPGRRLRREALRNGRNSSAD